MIEGTVLPSIGSSIVLKRAEIEIGGVAWSRAGRCGIRFDGLAYVDEWIAGKKLAGKANTSIAQRRVDVIQSALRSGQSLDIFQSPDDPSSRFSTSLSRDELQNQIGEEVAVIQRLLKSITVSLSDDPLMIGRYSDHLKSIHTASEVLDHLAFVLQSTDPAAAAKTIPMQALRSRLFRKALF